jgi:hypothetical protein
MFQRFTAIVNNMKANVEDFPYTEHDQALKLLHVLDQNVWGAKVASLSHVCVAEPHLAAGELVPAVGPEGEGLRVFL